jgi:hypothetical protein
MWREATNFDGNLLFLAKGPKQDFRKLQGSLKIAPSPENQQIHLLLLKDENLGIWGLGIEMFQKGKRLILFRNKFSKFWRLKKNINKPLNSGHKRLGG